MESYRFFIFLFSLGMFSCLEVLFSYRERRLKRKERWGHNFALIIVGSVIGKVILPSGLAVICNYALTHGLGFFNLVKINFFLEFTLSLLILDLMIYFQHWFSHKNSFFWKLHRVHHTDIDLDATSALRFHPLEILFSLLFKVILILVFGFKVESILFFEIILNFMAMFNHSNLHLPHKVETFVRKFIVTPQMHLIHHSIYRRESDTNYGFNFSFWDRVFKTYSDRFRGKKIIGNKRFQGVEEQRVLKLLTQPFR